VASIMAPGTSACAVASRPPGQGFFAAPQRAPLRGASGHGILRVMPCVRPSLSLRAAGSAGDNNPSLDAPPPRSLWRDLGVACGCLVFYAACGLVAGGGTSALLPPKVPPLAIVGGAGTTNARHTASADVMPR
jgi:hypothetical protein